MSDQTPSAPVSAPVGKPSDTPKGETKRTRKAGNPVASKSAFSVTDLARARLRERGIRSDENLVSECKVVRGILRANFTLVRKHDAAVRKAKDAPNDRKPWPSTMNRSTYDVAVKGKRK